MRRKKNLSNMDMIGKIVLKEFQKSMNWKIKKKQRMRLHIANLYGVKIYLECISFQSFFF